MSHEMKDSSLLADILRKFEDGFQRSRIRNKMTLDTSSAKVEESLAEFLQKVDPFLNDRDRLRILARRAIHKGDWL